MPLIVQRNLYFNRQSCNLDYGTDTEFSCCWNQWSLRRIRNLSPVSPDSTAIDLLNQRLGNLPPTSPLRQEIVAIISPAYSSQREAAKRLNVSQSLVGRATSLDIEDNVMNSIKQKPGIKHYHQQTTVQLAVAHNIMDNRYPMNSAHKRKSEKTRKKLFAEYQKYLPTGARALNKSYFYQLLNEMKIAKVKTIQQCSYCSDLSTRLNSLSPQRLAECFIHQHIKERQEAAFFKDREELQDGRLGMRIFEKSFEGGIIVVDYSVMKPSSSRHEDLIIHCYSNSDRTDRSVALHTIGSTTQKTELLFEGIFKYYFHPLSWLPRNSIVFEKRWERVEIGFDLLRRWI